MEVKKFLSIPIFCVFFVVGFVYYITVFIFLDDWLGIDSRVGLVNALSFTFFASLCLFSYFVCVLKDPGSVPSAYVPDVEDQESKKTGLLEKQCDKCSAYKPPRVHHCRECRRCVLRMDHHCVWINNCVGYRNYKAFVVLVFYATITSAYSAVILVNNILHKSWDFSEAAPLKLFYSGTGAVIVGLSFTLGTLLSWHIYLIICNITTVEFHKGKQAEWVARKSGLTYRHPFDVGAYKNITLIMGTNVLKWFCPTAVSHLKDGLSFPTSREHS